MNFKTLKKNAFVKSKHVKKTLETHVCSKLPTIMSIKDSVGDFIVNKLVPDDCLKKPTENEDTYEKADTKLCSENNGKTNDLKANKTTDTEPKVQSAVSNTDHSDKADNKGLIELLKRKDIKLSSVKGQRILRVDTVDNLLKENAYFIAYIKDLLIAPVQNINLYIDKMIFTFASIVSILPASLVLHDSKEGGLLAHSLHSALKALELVKQYKGTFVKTSFNEIETVLLALIHDLGKIITDVIIEDESSSYTYRALCIDKHLFVSFDKDTRSELINTLKLEFSETDARFLFVCNDTDDMILKIEDKPEYSKYLSFYPLDEFIKRTNSTFLFVSYRQKRSYNHDEIFIFVLSVFLKDQVQIIKKINRHKGVSYIHSILTRKDDKAYRTLLKRADIYACFTSQMNNFGVNSVEEYLYGFIKSGLFSNSTQGAFLLKNGYFVEYGSIAHQKLVRAFDCFYALNLKSSSFNDSVSNYEKIVTEVNRLYESDTITSTDDVFLQNYTFRPFFKALTDTSILTQRTYKRSCTYTELTDKAGIRHIVYGFHVQVNEFTYDCDKDIYVISFDVFDKDIKDKLIPSLKKYLKKIDSASSNTEVTAAKTRAKSSKNKRTTRKVKDSVDALEEQSLDSKLDIASSLEFISDESDLVFKDDNVKECTDYPFTYVKCTKGSSHICIASVTPDNLDKYFDLSTLRFNYVKEQREKEGIARNKAKRKATLVSKTDLNTMLSDAIKDEKEFLRVQENECKESMIIDWF